MASRKSRYTVEASAGSRFRYTLKSSRVKTAADGKRKPSKSETRELENAPPYDKEKIVHIKNLVNSIGKALGGLHEAVKEIASVKAHEISPDGRLGGQGYVMSVKDFKDTLANSMNSVSNLMDTVADELTNPSWELSKDEINEILNGSGSTEGFGDELDTTEAPEEELPEGGDVDALLDSKSTDAEEPDTTTGDKDLLDGLKSMQEEPAPTDAPAPEDVQSAPVEASPDVSNIPYAKLAHFPGNPTLDPVANILRAPILFNMFDRRAQ
jgi:hypothetical protein